MVGPSPPNENHELHESHETDGAVRGVRGIRGSVADGAPLAFALALVFALGALSGCIGAYKEYKGFDPDREYKNPGVFTGNYTFPGNVLVAGPYSPGEPEVVHLRSALPAYDPTVGEQTSDGTVIITMAIWRPQNVTEPVPVIVDAGPYYEMVNCVKPGPDKCQQWDNGTIDKLGQQAAVAVEQFLPHGYAVAQLAVRGTGTSGGCMDLMGPAEMHDIDQAMTWLGEQPWSNGNVGLIGVSYDGSTPWEAAATGNPHVKTIVPISGIADIYDLMFHNGTAETRGAIMHDQVYWPFGFSPEFLNVNPPVQPPPEGPVPPISPIHPIKGIANGRQQYQDMQNLLCPEVYEGVVMGDWARAMANRGSAFDSYWAERDHRQQVLDNYRGSIFLVHGLQDWNVDPHVALPFNQQLRAAGFEMKEWYGQWNHASPGSNCLARTPDWATMPCRIDWQEVLLRWFDRYLKGNTTNDLGPSVQVQDDVGYWRNADSFPPMAATWTDLHLSSDGRLAPGAATAGEALLQGSTPAASGNFVEFKGDALTEDLRFSGLPQLHVPFQPQGEGGQLAFWLFDEDGDGKVRAPVLLASQCQRGKCQIPPAQAQPPIIGHGQLNLRYYAGGETMQTLTPGQTYTAMGEFEPLEVLVPKGHHLSLWVFQGQYLNPSQGGGAMSGPTATPGNVKLLLGDQAVLRLPVVMVDPETIFPVPVVRMPDRDLYERMDITKPLAPPMNAVPQDMAGTLPVPLPVAAQPSAQAAPATCLPPGTRAAICTS